MLSYQIADEGETGSYYASARNGCIMSDGSYWRAVRYSYFDGTWRSGIHIRTSSDGGKTWSTEYTITNQGGSANDSALLVSMDLSPDDTLHVSYYSFYEATSPITNKLTHLSRVAGVWGAATTIWTLPANSGKVSSMRVDSTNMCHFVAPQTYQQFQYRTLSSGGVLGAIETISVNIVAGANLEIDSDDKPHVVWEEGEEALLMYSNRVSGSWASAEQLHDIHFGHFGSSYTADQNLGFDSLGNLWLVFCGYGWDRLYIQKRAGSAWGSRVTIVRRPGVSEPCLGFSPSGRMYVYFNQGDYYNRLMRAYSSDGKHWATEILPFNDNGVDGQTIGIFKPYADAPENGVFTAMKQGDSDRIEYLLFPGVPHSGELHPTHPTHGGGM